MNAPEDSVHDFGAPPDIVYEDFENLNHRRATAGLGASWSISSVDGQERYRLKMLMIRGADDVEELWIVKVDGDVSSEVMHLSGEAAARFVALIRNNAFEPSRTESGVVAPPKVMPDAAALSAAYEHNPAALRMLIESDGTAEDVVAIAHRRKVVSEFRTRIEDPQHFDSLVSLQSNKSKEGVWQEFFEANPWLLGVGLGDLLLIGLDETKLEKMAVGADIGGPGKRADGVLKTPGAVSLLSLAEIKHHRTDLLAKDSYRSGCWPPSIELAGAISQSQGTVQLVLERFSDAKIETKNEKGFTVPSRTTYLYRPRSYVLIGNLSEFVDSDTGGRNDAMVRSFELLRRNLYEPVVITYDELLARAEALVAGHNN